MKIKLTINGKEIEAEIKDEDIKKIEEKKSYLPWRAELGGVYWVLTARGIVVDFSEDNEKSDEYRYLVGNYFKTKEECEAKRERDLAIGRVSHAILEANEGWEPDWDDNKEYKWSILYNINTHSPTFMPDNHLWNKIQNVIPFIVSKEIAKKIIKDHEKDLKLIFNT